jgi:hypothetical protein
MDPSGGNELEGEMKGRKEGIERQEYTKWRVDQAEPKGEAYPPSLRDKRLVNLAVRQRLAASLVKEIA